MAEINKPEDVNKIWAISGTATAPSDAKIAQGWIVEAPPYQTENYINRKHDMFIAHANQHGLPVWDNVTEYQGGKSWTLGSNGSLYFSKVTSINQNPVSDVAETYWRKVLDGTNVVPSASISSFALTLLDDTSADIMLNTLGGTTIGKALFRTTSQSNARNVLGASTIGQNMFTAANQEQAFNALSLPSFVQGLLNLTNASNWRNTLQTTDAGNLLTGTVSSARLPASTEFSTGAVVQATQSEVNAGVDTTKYVTPAKMKFGASASLGTTGFLKLPSWLFGLEIRWGQLTVGGNNFQSTGDIFTTVCLQGVCSLGSPTDVDRQAPNIVPSGRSVILYNPDGGTNLLIRYIAIGY